MAMCALTLGKRGLSVALMDADMTGGGLGVLLGVEHEQGLTLQNLNAPLGHIEGNALNHELPAWEGMRILAHAPWAGADPDWWEVQAAVRALCESNDIVLVDAGRGGALGHVPDLARARQVVAVELSALGVARASPHIAMLERAWRHDEPDNDGRIGDGPAVAECESPIVVGVTPRRLMRHSPSATAMQEAIARFGEETLGPLGGDPSLCADIMNGLGVRAVPKSCRQVVEALVDGIVTPPEPARTARHRGPKRARRKR